MARVKVLKTTRTEDPTARVEGRWEFKIPDWRPASLNELLAGGPFGAARLKKRDREYVWGYSLQAGVPPSGRQKRRVSLRITLPKGKKRTDIDSLQKSTLDACVQAKLLFTDGEDWAEWGGVKYDRGAELSTTIIIEDLP